MSRARIVPLVAAALAVLAAAVLAGCGATGDRGARAAVCADFATQAAAQAAADTRDADGDGVYCEALPCPCAGPGDRAPGPGEDGARSGGERAGRGTAGAAEGPDGGAPADGGGSGPSADGAGSAGEDPTTPASGRPDPEPGDPPGCRVVPGVVDIGLSGTAYPEVREHWERAIAGGEPRILRVRRAGAEERRRRLLAGVPSRPGHDRDEYPPAMARATIAADVALVDARQNRGAGSVQGIKLRRWCSGQRFQIVWY